MSRQWCNACQMRPMDGCRHPLGTQFCPYRQSDQTVPKLQSCGFGHQRNSQIHHVLRAGVRWWVRMAVRCFT